MTVEPLTTKFPPVFLKHIFSPDFYSGANPTIIILCYTFSVYFLKKWTPFLPEILAFPFPDFPFYTFKLPSWVYSLFYLKLSDVQEAFLHTLCRILNRLWLFSRLLFCYLELRPWDCSGSSSVEVYCNGLWMSPVSLIWRQSVINQRAL